MSKASQVLLSVIEATKSYGARQSLRGVNLNLHAGEILGLLGPNGAGKTTLIRSIAGRVKLDSGSISFSAMRRGPRNLGVVPQSIALYEDLTAEQNLRAFGRLHRVPRSALAERIDQALVWANLQDRRHDVVGAFSGGMKRRINIACSVLHRPKVLLLDEPTVGVDPQSRERIYDMLGSLKSNDTAIMIATHHLEEAEQRCDRIAILDRGAVNCVGTFNELVLNTVGTRQLVSVRFRKRMTELPGGFQLDKSGRVGRRLLQNVAAELPHVMQTLESHRLPIEQVTLQGPSLQHVFLHLTGRELRESC